METVKKFSSKNYFSRMVLKINKIQLLEDILSYTEKMSMGQRLFYSSSIEKNAKFKMWELWRIWEFF